MEKNEKKLYFTVFGLSSLLFIIVEVLEYGKLIDIFKIEIISNSYFLVLGLIGTYVSFLLYRYLEIKKDISMVNFLLFPQKLSQELKVIYYTMMINGVCWFIHGILFFIYFEYRDLFEIYLRPIVFIYDISPFSSILLAITCIMIFYRWLKRLRLYA